MYEYDIRQANINMLRAEGIISEDYYNDLQNIPKRDREITIGKMSIMRDYIDKKIMKVIQDNIKKYKDLFLNRNNINPDSVVRIANDAIVVLTSLPIKQTQFDTGNGNQVEFVNKNIYTSMVRFSKSTNRTVSIFLNILPDDSINVDVKGISDDSLSLKFPDFLVIITDIIKLLERTDKNMVFRYFNNVYNDYINLRLPLNAYRDFVSGSFILKRNKPGYYPQPTIITENELVNIDISRNQAILREFYSYIINYYK